MQVLSRQRGVSLIEVLVAMLIFSVGVLGIALMQIKGSQFSKQAGSRTVAVLQARSLADAMRANPAGVYGVASEAEIAGKKGDLSGSYYLYDGTAAPDPTSCSGSCGQAKSDLAAWLKELRAGTSAPVKSDGSTGNPSGLATVTVNTDNTGTLVIASSWNGMNPNSSGVSTNDTYRFDFQP